jgi:hypothetical protein
MQKRSYYKIKIFMTLFGLIMISINASAEVNPRSLMFINQITPEFCKHNQIKSYIVFGTFEDIVCDFEEGADYPQICELIFTPDPGQDHDYIPVYETYIKGGSNPYTIDPSLREFQAPAGSKVELLIERHFRYIKLDEETEFCNASDVVVKISSAKKQLEQTNKPKVELGDDINDLLANANKSPEQRKGIAIKKIQLGMNEYNFLTNIIENFPALFKNHSMWYLGGDFNKDPDTNLIFYLLLTKEQVKLFPPYEKINEFLMLNLVKENLLSLAIFDNGLLISFQITGEVFQEIFKKSNTPYLPFLQAFVNGYHLNMEPQQKNKLIEYIYVGDNSSWKIGAKVDRSKDSVLSIYMSIIEPEENPEFD